MAEEKRYSLWTAPIRPPTKEQLETAERLRAFFESNPSFFKDLAAERAARQALCSHEDALCFTGWIGTSMGWSGGSSYTCTGCGYHSRSPIGQYAGMRQPTLAEALSTPVD